nr:MAG TPA: hypothetical protein [Caudoviricetes sp.]
MFIMKRMAGKYRFLFMDRKKWVRELQTDLFGKWGLNSPCPEQYTQLWKR